MDYFDANDGHFIGNKRTLYVVPHHVLRGGWWFEPIVIHLDLSYENRLLQCGLTKLYTSRLRGDQIKVFKIVNGYEDVDRNMFFKLKEGSRTRRHKAALVKEHCRLDMRKYSISQRVINDWNKLQNYCVKASSLNMFKNIFDIYMIRAGYT